MPPKMILSIAKELFGIVTRQYIWKLPSTWEKIVSAVKLLTIVWDGNFQIYCWVTMPNTSFAIERIIFRGMFNFSCFFEKSFFRSSKSGPKVVHLRHSYFAILCWICPKSAILGLNFVPEILQKPPHPTFIRLHMLLCVKNRCHIKKSVKPKKLMRIYGFSKMGCLHLMLNWTKSAILGLTFVPKILRKAPHTLHSSDYICCCALKTVVPFKTA